MEGSQAETIDGNETPISAFLCLPWLTLINIQIN